MSRALMITLVSLAVGLPARAEAQTVKDKVKDHVDKELDDNKRERSRRKGTSKRRSRGSDQGSSNRGGPAHAVSVDLTDPVLSGRSRLPLRLFPRAARYIKFDIKIDSAYRGWLPQQYASADIDVASFYTWSVGVKARFFKHLALHRAYYESNRLSTPRNKDAVVAAQVGKQSKRAAKALAYLGFDLWRSWQPIVRYEAQSFSTVATPTIPLCIVDRRASGDLMDCPRTMGKLQVVSTFETLVAGVRWSPQVANKSVLATHKALVPPVYFGLGLMSYRKPYQVSVDGVTLEEFLFNGEFRGAGLAAGTHLGGGARRFFAQIDVQLGLGDVSLTDDFTLNEVTPDDWLIGYVQGNLRGGYRLVVFEGPPTVYFTPTVSAGGASFHFVSTNGESDESPSLNWDFLWSARAALEVAL